MPLVKLFCIMLKNVPTLKLNNNINLIPTYYVKNSLKTHFLSLVATYVVNLVNFARILRNLGTELSMG